MIKVLLIHVKSLHDSRYRNVGVIFHFQKKIQKSKYELLL